MYYHDYKWLYGARGRAVLPSSLWGGMAEKRHVGGGRVTWSFDAVSLQSFVGVRWETVNALATAQLRSAGAAGAEALVSEMLQIVKCQVNDNANDSRHQNVKSDRGK
jgi:hypothetical protein